MKTYNELAKYYDLTYLKKDYAKEIKLLTRFIFSNKKSWGRDLLDVACGTGRHISLLKNRFTCTGVDVSPAMLKEAKKNSRGVKFFKGDMKNFKLNKSFDVVTCLFSAIGHLKNYNELEKTIKNFSAHLKPGGVLLIEPWMTNIDFNQAPYLLTYESEDLKIARLSVGKGNGDNMTFDFNFLVAEKGKPVKHFIDVMTLTKFDVKKTKKIMEKYGMKARFDKRGILTGKGLFIGTKRFEQQKKETKINSKKTKLKHRAKQNHRKLRVGKLIVNRSKAKIKSRNHGVRTLQSATLSYTSLTKTAWSCCQ